jgi:hypothetical protein
MIIAQIINNQITVGEHTDLFPTGTFSINGPDSTFMEQNNCFPVIGGLPYNQDTEKLVRVEPYLENGQVYIIQVEPLTEEELISRENSIAEAARTRRNNLLKDSDWTQGRDIQDSIAESWAIYRQDLRDITAQEDFPQNITWPTPPGSNQE